MKPEQYAGYTPEEPEHGGSYHQTGPSSVYVERRQPETDAVTLSGPFCRTFILSNAWKLTGGSVTGGSGNVVVADINLGSVSSLPANGTYFFLVCSGTAVAEDDVLLPGFTLSTATVASGTSIPSNTIPTAASTSGVLRISLGSWSNGVFVPAGCGNIQIFHCPGTFTHVRG